MARTPSAMDAPFHPDIGFLAQRRRGLLRNPHKAQAQARRLSLRRRPASRDQPLPRRAQSAIEGLHLDRQSRRNHRRSQARAPSVRFDPLAAGSAGARRLSDEMRDNSYNILKFDESNIGIEARRYNPGPAPRTHFKFKLRRHDTVGCVDTYRIHRMMAARVTTAR